ncbi:fimbrial protein [Caballeronia insecticola]|uniref:Fimbrial protein n=1 Tax=Caballeronia insecticola TaxID=758793 RepID=R4WFS4_9BURK|nr:fimbrial protein [Caballeronia insecticola]BAN22424.1 fimbrial protein [Caballeronia insecticola]
MRTLRALLAVFALFVATSMVAAFAASDANLTFTGDILQPTCTVDSTTANQTIALGSVPISNFANVGSTANPRPFNIGLLNCSPNATVNMTVGGTMDTVPTVLQNTGTATQVGVQLLLAGSVGGTTGTPITLNSTINLGVVNASNAMTVPFVAQFYRLGTMTAGTVTATATVNFTYY